MYCTIFWNEYILFILSNLVSVLSSCISKVVVRPLVARIRLVAAVAIGWFALSATHYESEIVLFFRYLSIYTYTVYRDLKSTTLVALPVQLFCEMVAVVAGNAVCLSWTWRIVDHSTANMTLTDAFNTNT